MRFLTLSQSRDMTHYSASGALIALLVLSGNAAGADGEALYAEKLCASCHGPTGNEPILSTYPKIAGQNKEYLIRQMNDIKSGDRDNGASTAMRGLVANLGDDEIVAIAEYLSSL